MKQLLARVGSTVMSATAVYLARVWWRADRHNFICVFCSLFAGWVAPHNPFDLTTFELGDARLPPAWMAEGRARSRHRRSGRGCSILSALIYGARISLAVGLISVACRCRWWSAWRWRSDRGLLRRRDRCLPDARLRVMLSFQPFW